MVDISVNSASKAIEEDRLQNKQNCEQAGMRKLKKFNSKLLTLVDFTKYSQFEFFWKLQMEDK